MGNTFFPAARIVPGLYLTGDGDYVIRPHEMLEHVGEDPTPENIARVELLIRAEMASVNILIEQMPVAVVEPIVEPQEELAHA